MSRYSKYPKSVVVEAVKASDSYSEAIRKLGMGVTGGTQDHIRGLIFKYNLDISHFDGGRSRRKLAMFTKRKSWQEILVKYPQGSPRIAGNVLTRALQDCGVMYRCNKCGNNGAWQAKPLILHVDHINQDSTDNRPDNLMFLCPNCHAQKPVVRQITSKWKCETCGIKVSYNAKRCLKCHNAQKAKVWTPQVSEDILKKLVWEMPLDKVANKLGVHRDTVRNWISVYGFESPPKGYWSFKNKTERPLKIAHIGIDRVIELVNQGGFRGAGKVLGVDEETVKYYLVKQGVAMDSRKKNKGIIRPLSVRTASGCGKAGVTV